MNNTDPRTRRTMKGSPTQGFAMSDAEAEKYQKEQTEKILECFRVGAAAKAAVGAYTGKIPSFLHLDNPAKEPTLYAAYLAGTKAVVEGQHYTEADIAPALVRFQVGQSEKAAKAVQEWSDTILNGIKNGGVNIDKAVENLWARAKVQAFTVPVIGSVTLADLRSDAFNVDTLKNAWNDIKWDDVSKSIIAGLAPEGGLADTALKTVNAVRDTLTTVQNIASGISGLGGLATALGGASTLLAAAMPYLLVAIALIAVGEAIFDYFDDSDEIQEERIEVRAQYLGLKDYICDLLYCREQTQYWGTVQMRLDELAWETVVCKRVRAALKRTEPWGMPRPYGPDGRALAAPSPGAPEKSYSMADRHVATAQFRKDWITPGEYYTDPEWQRLATWSTGEQWARKAIRSKDLHSSDSDRDKRRTIRANKDANKFLQSVINYLSQEAMTLDDKRVAFELLGIQLLSDASHFSYGLWDTVRPTLYPTNPLPPATGLVGRNNNASPVRPINPLPPTTALPLAETQALGTKEIMQIVSSTSASPYGQQALEVLAGCFYEPVSSFITTRGASGPLPPRSFVARTTSPPVPAVLAPQPSLFLSPFSQIEVAASLMFAGGQWNLAGLSVAPNFTQSTHLAHGTVTETLPLGGSVVDWCNRVVIVRFKCGHVSAATVKVIGVVNDAPEVWQRGPVQRDGTLRSPFQGAVGTVFVAGVNEPGVSIQSLTGAMVSPVGAAIKRSLTQDTPFTKQQGVKVVADLRNLLSAMPTDAPATATGFGSSSFSKPLMLGTLAAIGVGVGAWALTRRHT